MSSTLTSSPPSNSLDHEKMSPTHHHNLSPMPYTIHAQIPASTTNQNSPPSSHIDSHDLSPQHNHHSLSPMPYTHQLPSPASIHAPTNLIMSNNLDVPNKYMQSFNQSNVDAYGMLESRFISTSIPKYYNMPDHAVKLEPSHHLNHHYQQHQDQHHQQQHQLMHSQHLAAHHQQVSTKFYNWISRIICNCTESYLTHTRLIIHIN